MTRLSQLQINDLSYVQFTQFDELSIKQTKLVAGGVTTFYGSRAKVEISQPLTDSETFLIGLEVAKLSSGQIDRKDLRINTDRIANVGDDDYSYRSLGDD